MENRKEDIDKLMYKLKVLDSRIKKLESLTDAVLNDVETAYQKRIKELNQKKDAAQKKLLKILETVDNG